MFIRNINKNLGMCNGSRCIVTGLGRLLIKAKLMSGPKKGMEILIPRITLSTNKEDFAFTLNRRQFPIRLCFAATINKSQGQTFQRVCLFLPAPVFGHGQLYVGCSRVGNPDDLGMVIVPGSLQGCIANDPDKHITKNVVYKEVL